MGVPVRKGLYHYATEKDEITYHLRDCVCVEVYTVAL